jgi:hypothetical protein
MPSLRSFLRILGAIAASVLVAVVCSEFALYALRPAAPLWTYPHTEVEFAVAVSLGVLCGVLFLWRVFRGSAVANELAKVERTVTSGDHLG